MSAYEKEILSAALIFIRALTFLFFIPFLGGQRLPMMLQLAIAFGICWLLCAQLTPASLPTDIINLCILGIKEGTVGFLMGLAVYCLFFAVEFAMQIVSNEIGFSMSTILDPSDAKAHNIIEALFIYLVSLIFLITNTHQELLLSFKKSFEFFPIGSEFKGVNYLIYATANTFILGLQIAAPIMLINFLINIAFFILGKAAPKINIFIISFSVRILAGLTVLMFVTSLIFQYIYRELILVPERMIEILLF